MHKSVPLIPVLSDAAPRPAGHYSQAMIAGQQVFISGQLPIRPDSASLPDDGFESQAEQAIANMLAILKAAGGTPERQRRLRCNAAQCASRSNSGSGSGTASWLFGRG